MSATGNQDYETITADGQHISVGSGETLSNLLVDVSNGGDFLITAVGTNWTIKNIGIRGYFGGGDFIISCRDSSNGRSLVENVYIGDGAGKHGADFVHGPGAIFVGPADRHTGHITFRECNVQGYPNNGFYCSNGPGSVKFENCLAVNNGVSNFRCGNTSGDEIRNCVAYNDNTDYGWYHEQNNYVEEDGRPLWMWGPGTVDVYNTDLAAGTYGGAIYIRGGSVNYVSGNVSGSTGGASLNSRVGSSPDLSPPAGVPLTPEQAASGGGSNAGGGGSQPDTGGGSGDGSDDGGSWGGASPPASPDRSAVMTGVAVHYTSNYDDIEIANCDFNWRGDGKVARARDGGHATFRNCRFDGDEPVFDG